MRAPLPIVKMAGEPGLPSHHDKIAEPGAARDADLTGQNAAATENDIVPDLHQIINHRARADHGIVSGAAVDRRVGADIDIVADDDPPELRDLDRAARIGREAEPGLADPHARDAARRGRRSGNGSASHWRRSGNRRRVRPRRRSPCSAPIRQRAPSRAPASITTWAPISQSCRHGRRRIDDRADGARRGVSAGFADRRPARRAQTPCRARARSAAPSRRGALSGQPLVDKRRAGARAGKRIGVFPVFEKASHRRDRRFRAARHRR